MTRYVALIDGKRGAYGATVPDLPGCTSAAASIDEVHRNAIDAVRLWIEDAEADGEAVPRPRSLEELRQDPDVAAALAQGAAFTIVPVLRDYGRPKNANISLDAGLLEAIDTTAAEHGLTRSGFLATAAVEKIGFPVRLASRPSRRVQQLEALAQQASSMLTLPHHKPAKVKRKRAAPRKAASKRKRA